MHILVIRFSSLGDVVLASAALHALAESHPGAEILFATKDSYLPLFDAFKGTMRVVPLRERQGLSEYISSLGDGHFDLVVDLHGSLRSRSLTARLRAGEIRRVDKHTRQRWQMVWSKGGLNNPLSVVDAYLDAAGAPGMGVRPRLYLSESEQARAMAGARENPRAMGIGWGAKHPTKSIPSDLWKRLILSSQDKSPLHIGIFGLQSDNDDIKQFVSHDLHGIGGITVETFVGLPLREVMVKMSSCGAFVSSDSGLMHLADALGVPSFGLFGPTHPALGFAPAGERSRAFHAGTWCSPCHRHGSAPCFRARRFCFDELDVAAIADAVASAWQYPGRSAQPQ